VANEERETASKRISLARQLGGVLAVGGTIFVIASVLSVVIPARFIFADKRDPGLATMVLIAGGLCFFTGVRLLFLAIKQFKEHS
jgi:hypothetical protein